MKISSYGLLVLVILAASAPTLALADSDDDQGSYQTQQQSSPAPTSTQTEHPGSNTAHSANSTISSLVLYGTISAILWVVGYSSWKVYKVRRKIASRKLV